MINKTKKSKSRKTSIIFLSFTITFVVLFLLLIKKTNAQVYNKHATQNIIYKETTDTDSQKIKKQRLKQTDKEMMNL